MSIIKIFVLSAYYLIYLTMEYWMQPLGVLCFILALAAGFWMALQGKKRYINYKIVLPVFLLILYAGIIFWEYNGSIVEPGIWGKILQYFYYVGMVCVCYGIGYAVYGKLNKEAIANKEEKETQKNYEKFWKRIKTGVLCLYIGSLIPMVLISPYVFSKADDYSFGYHAHIAWEKTGSVFAVIKAAFVMIAEAWTDWQGTFSSIFFMAIQPGVFSERLYAIVPCLFIMILTLSSYFFMKTIFVDRLGADKTLSQICIWSYLVLAIQRVPDIQSAFIWYNGATHYITSHCALLCAIACIVKWLMQKKKTAWAGAALFVVYVGGGNYVTAVASLLLCLTVLFSIAITKSWKKYQSVLGICMVYFVALALNFVAPGNLVRKGRFEGYNIVTAFGMAFTESFRHMFGEWMHWSIVLFVLFMIPVFWHLVSKVNFDFKYPGLVLGYSWCYMASLFFAPLFTLGEVDVGRFQNVMFLEWMLLLMFDIAYIIGWMQRKFRGEYDFCLQQSGKGYMQGILLITSCCLGLSILAEPGNYTSVYAYNTWRDPGLKTYEQAYWDMVEILNSEETVVEIADFSYIPPLFDVSLRHEGLRLFYEKEKVIIKEAQK